jgi:phage baseplate assembly protein W
VQALDDESDEAVRAAIERAVQAAVRGAVAMGLPRVELRGARGARGTVTVQVLALEAEPEGPQDEPAGPVINGKTML